MSPLRDDPAFIGLEKKVERLITASLNTGMELEGNSKLTVETSEKLSIVSQKFDKLEEKFEKLEGGMEGVVKAFNSARGAFDTLEWVGKVSKVLLPIILAIAGLGVALASWWGYLKRTIGIVQ